MGFRGLTINTPEEAEEHVFAENDAAIYQAIFGAGDLLLNYGDNFGVDIISYNTVRVNSGLVAVQGHMGIIETNDDQEIVLENGTSGVTRNDLIVVEFTTTGNHGLDTFTMKALRGGADGSLPQLTVQDLTNGGTTRQFAIAKVTMTGLSITDATVIPTVAGSLSELLYAINDRISYGTSEPSGGKDGDIYIMYT